MANEKKPEFERIDYGARRNAINDFLKAARDAKTYNKNGHP